MLLVIAVIARYRDDACLRLRDLECGKLDSSLVPPRSLLLLRLRLLLCQLVC